MSSRAMSLAQIQKAGMEALLERLGTVGTVRFLQQLETGSGDYTKERERWLDQPDVDTVADEIENWKKGPSAL